LRQSLQQLNESSQHRTLLYSIIVTISWR